MRLGKFAKRVLSERWPFLVVCLFVALMGLPVATCAATDLDESDYIKYSENDINKYDRCEGTDDDESERKCVVPSGDQITWIGDSYSVGAQSIIESEFPGISFGGSVNDPNSYIQSCKFVGREGCNGNPTNPSGLDVLEKIIDDGKLKPYLVFALGTNGGWTVDDSVNRFKRVMEGHDDTIVIFVNSKVPGNNYADSNRVLKDLANSSDNYYLADWASEEKDEWFADGIHPSVGDGYQVWVNTIKEALPASCTAGLVSEDTNEGIVWNYFVRADIDGVSDNPAAIAGIMGNLYQESRFDPFAVSGSGYYGIHQTQDQSFINKVNRAGLGQYWGNGSSASAADVKKAIKLELDWVIENNPRWGGGAGWNRDVAFTPNLNNVEDTNSPESYADLFMVTVEGCYPYGTDAIKDRKVKDIAAINSWTTDEWQIAEARRSSARDIYDRLASSGSLPSDSDSEFSSTEQLSGGGNVKYDIEDGDLEILLRFALYEANKSSESYEDILSGILDDFEKNNGEDKGNSDKLMEYVRDANGQFIYKDDFKEFLRDDEARNASISSDQLEKARSIVIDGLRTTSGAQSEIEGKKTSSTCPSKGKGKGIGAAKIAETAALMSWPVQSWQTGADDFATDRVGKCNGGSGWIPFVYEAQPCATNPRDLYKTNWNTFPGQGWYDMYMDCGYFVSTVLNYLGVADHSTKYQMSGQPTMAGAGEFYPGDLRESSDWQEIENKGESSMKPGDVLVSDGHIMIYVGERYGGDYGHLAHASRGTRVGEIGGMWDEYSWRIYRYTGDKLGDGGDMENGLTEEDANKLAHNYTTNKGNWSGYPNNIKVAAYGNYCHSTLCASDYSNCTLFSGFFAEMFWGVAQRGWPNGSLVVNDLKNLGYSTGREPRPFAIFSTTSFHGNDHTGVVVAVDGDKIATIEAGYPSWNAAYHDFESIAGHNIEFAYPNNIDYDKLTEFINR